MGLKLERKIIWLINLLGSFGYVVWSILDIGIFDIDLVRMEIDVDIGTIQYRNERI